MLTVVTGLYRLQNFCEKVIIVVTRRVKVCGIFVRNFLGVIRVCNKSPIPLLPPFKICQQVCSSFVLPVDKSVDKSVDKCFNYISLDKLCQFVKICQNTVDKIVQIDKSLLKAFWNYHKKEFWQFFTTLDNFVQFVQFCQ